MDDELMTIEGYAEFAGVRPRTVRRWIEAGFIYAFDIEPDGRLFREGASFSLIAYLATPTATRLMFRERAAIDAGIDRAAAAFQAWAVGAPPSTWAQMRDGYQLAEALRREVAKFGPIEKLFATFHREPGAAERRAILRRPDAPSTSDERAKDAGGESAEPSVSGDPAAYLWELRHPVIPEEERKRLRHWARIAGRSAAEAEREERANRRALAVPIPLRRAT